jgi:hypothetical protein
MKVALIKGQEAATHWLRYCIGMLLMEHFIWRMIDTSTVLRTSRGFAFSQPGKSSLLVMTLC